MGIFNKYSYLCARRMVEQLGSSRLATVDAPGALLMRLSVFGDVEALVDTSHPLGCCRVGGNHVYKPKSIISSISKLLFLQ